MLVLMEGIVMCFILLLVCTIGIADGPVGMVTLYTRAASNSPSQGRPSASTIGWALSGSACRASMAVSCEGGRSPSRVLVICMVRSPEL